MPGPYGQPQQPGYGAPYGGPAGPPGPPGASWPAAPTPPRRRTGLLVVAAVAAVVLIGASVAFVALRVLRRGGGVDSGPLIEVLDRLDAKIELDPDTRYADLGERCDLGDLDALLDNLPDGVSAGLDDDVVTQYAVQQGNVGDPQIYGCTQGGDRYAGFSVGRAPEGDYEDYLNRAVADFGDLTIEQRGSLRGGKSFAYCLEVDGDRNACGADWTDGKVQVSLVASRLDASEMQQWLRDNLEELLRQTGEARPSGIRVRDP